MQAEDDVRDMVGAGSGSRYVTLFPSPQALYSRASFR